MKSIQEMSMAELAGYVCSQLEAKGIKTVLSGGCCVEIYSRGKYTSDDIDLIDRFNGGHREIKEVMIALRFEEYNRYFRHKDTEYFIEFPRGPLTVGFENVKDTVSKEYETGILKLLTATDCIKDRLAAYFHWDDLQSLEQAIWVAEKNEIDLDAIEAWSKAEMEYDKFIIFRDKLFKRGD
jgi:hypothetical protein